MKVRLVWAVCLLWCAVASASLPPLNAQLGLAYDKSGNLLFRTNGSLVQTFATDAGNQLTSITRTGPLTVSGATPGPASSVTVNGTNAQLYGDWTFAATNQILVNGQNPFTIIAQSATGARITNSSIDYLPTTVNLAYDANGCLTNDGTLAMFYDAENRLTNITASASWKTDFIYDGLGRRRVARDYGWASGNWQLTNETRTIYDGLLPVQERDSNSVATVTYTRGLDLSGSRQGAGGIGGLLALTQHSTNSSQHFFYHADGAGNVTALLDSRHVLAARYEYLPFGQMVGKWWALADANTMGFSSMPGTRGIVFYRERPYLKGLERWGTPDPIGEAGGINLYGFVGNNPVRNVDPLGLQGLVLEMPPILLEPPPVTPSPEMIAPRPVGVPLPRIPGVSYPRSGPFPPEGTIENPFRPGSFGRIRPDTGKFQECWRYDKANPTKPGWGGLDHFHHWGGPEHMTPPLPPFQWFSAPPSINPVNAPPTSLPVPPNVTVPPGLIPPPPSPPQRGTIVRPGDSPVA